MAFRIALTAGHYMGTPGKRCMKKLDKNQTREWWLNNRIADKVEALLKNYTGYQLLRTDDTTGKKDISLTARTNAANNFKADFYLSIHHNAGVAGGKGGGIVAIVYSKTKNAESIAWQKELYSALIAATGLKGNRASPLAKQNLHEVRETKMAAVLLELGFMDSATDVPIILTEKYADQCAAAIVKVIVKRGKLKAKTAAPAKKTVEVNLPVLQRGDKCMQVRAAQVLLNAQNAPCGDVDGSFGPSVEKAVEQFQKREKLPQTKKLDTATWQALFDG